MIETFQEIIKQITKDLFGRIPTIIPLENENGLYFRIQLIVPNDSHPREMADLNSIWKNRIENSVIPKVIQNNLKLVINYESQPDPLPNTVNYLEKIKIIGDSIAELSPEEFIEIVDYLKKVHNLSISMCPLMPMNTYSGPPLPYQNAFWHDIYIESFNPELKINAIRAVRNLTRLGLKESKELVERTHTEPQVLQYQVCWSDVATIKEELEKSGMSVIVKAIAPETPQEAFSINPYSSINLF